MPAPADVVAAGGVASTSGANTNYNFNASVPAQRAGFFGLLQDVSHAPNSVWYSIHSLYLLCCDKITSRTACAAHKPDCVHAV